MTQLAPLVFLLDVDNTLLDNDGIIEDLNEHLTRAFGVDCQQRYWKIFEKRRAELGYADYLGALQRYRAENPRDLQILQISFFLLELCLRPPAVPGLAGRDRSICVLGANRHPLRRRRHFSAVRRSSV